MKICINGDIINTNKIYNITKIEESNYGFCFYVLFLNKKQIFIECRYIDLKNQYYPEIKRVCDLNNIQIKHIESIILKKLNKFRDSIVEIWSKNQSEIPQFNLDNNEIN